MAPIPRHWASSPILSLQNPSAPVFAMEDVGFPGSVFPMGRSIDQGSGGFRRLEEGSGSGEQFRDTVKGKDPLKPALETLFPEFDHVQGHHMRPNSPPQGEDMADTEVTMEGGQEADDRQRMAFEGDSVEGEDRQSEYRHRMDVEEDDDESEDYE